jgi:PAS domain S-box-containing protein
MAPSSGTEYWLKLAAAFAAYWAAGKLGLAAPFTNTNVSPVWPASGVALAVLLRWGVRFWPGITLGAFLFNFFSPIPHAAAFPIALGNTLSAVVGTLVLQRIGFRTSLERLSDVLALMGIGALMSPIVAASIGVTGLFLSGAAPWSSFARAWLVWWVGDAMGVLIVAPLLLKAPRINRSLKSVLEAALLPILLALATLLVFDNRIGLNPSDDALALIVFPFVIWAAIRFQVGGAAVAAAVVAVIAVWETANGSGPFVRFTALQDALLLQLLLALVSGTGLVIAAVMSERVKAEDALQTEQALRIATAALQESEQRFRTMAETASDAVFTIDTNSTILFVNQAAERTFGYTVEEMQGRELTMLMPEYYRALHQSAVGRYLATHERHLDWSSVELPGLHKSGREVPLELSFGEFVAHGRHLFTGYARDITQRKRAERRLATQHAVTRVLAESDDLVTAAPKILQSVCECLGWEMGAIWLVDPRAQVLRCLEVWHQPLAHMTEFVVGTRERTFAPGIGLPGRVWSCGAAAWVPDVTADSNFPRAAVAERAQLHGAFGFPIRAADQIRGVVEFFSSEIREPDPELLRMADALGTQIGELLQRKEAEAALRSAEKLAAAGRLAGTIAHEINNPLESVTNILYLLRIEPSLTETGRQYAKTAEMELARVAQIARRTLTFYRESWNPAPVNIPELLNGLVQSYSQKIAAGRVSVERRFRSDSTISALGDELRQVFSNLLINALDAMENGGTLTLCVYASRNWCTGRRGVRVLVADTGPGIRVQDRKMLFEPFYTSKKQTGTGLGLWIAREIVQKHGGTIRVANRLSAGLVGSCFAVFLPDDASEQLLLAASRATGR